MNNQPLKQDDELISATIHKRKVTYYLVSEDDINSLKTKSGFADLFIFLASLAWGGHISIHITRASGIELQQQTTSTLIVLLWVFGIGGLIFTALAILFFLSAKSAIDRIKGLGIQTQKIGEQAALSLTTGSDPQFWVVSANYGTQKKSFDVTDKLNALIRDGQLVTVSSNSLAGDPDFGTPKILRVKYKDNGVLKTRDFPENDQVNLP